MNCYNSVMKRSTVCTSLAAGVALAILMTGCAAPGADRAAPVPVSSPNRSKAVAVTNVAAGTRLGVGGCPLFPRDNAFRADVRSLPVAPGSVATVASAGGPSATLRPGFTSQVYQGSRGGIPVNVIDRATAVPTDFSVAAIYADRSQASAVPMPPAPRFEGWPGRAWDRHLLLVDGTTCTSRELINVQPPGENLGAPASWYADSVVSVDLSTNDALPFSTNASGFSLLAGMVRYDEVAAGDVGHAIGLTLPGIRRGAPVWPAQSSDGRSTDPQAPPMGTWLRLRPEADLARLGPQARVVARALQTYGAIVVDTGPAATLTGEPDQRWDDVDLATLSGLNLADMEVVDPTSMRADARPDSLRIR